MTDNLDGMIQFRDGLQSSGHVVTPHGEEGQSVPPPTGQDDQYDGGFIFPPELQDSPVDQQPAAHGDKIDSWGEPYTLADAFKPRPPVQWIVNGLFKLPSLNLIIGEMGGLKTMLVCDLCLSVASGLDFLPPSQWLPGAEAFKTMQVPTMFIDFDNGKDELSERFEAIAKARQIPADIPFYYYTFPNGGLDAGNKKHIGQLAERMDRLGIKLLGFDNLGIIKGRADENTDQMIPVMNNLRWLCENTRSSILGIHHQPKFTGQNKDNYIRGHGSIKAALNVGVAVEREPYSDTIKVKQVKQRGYRFLPFEAQFTYTHKQDATELYTAMFYGIPTTDTVSDAAVEREVIDTLKTASEPPNKTTLAGAVHKALPEIGINRIRQMIDIMAELRKILVRPGSGTEKLYYHI
jgi:RecA-family ATPase